MKTHLSIGRCAFAVLMALLVAGCATTPSRYKPTISEVDIPTDHQAGIQMLVTLAAVRADRKAGTPAGIEARIRLQNQTNTPARISPSSLELVDADLQDFEAPRVSPAGGLDVKPGGRAVMSAFFPYPASAAKGSHALASLDLRWRVDAAGNMYAHGVTFHRRESREVVYNYAGPYYWGPGWGWGWNQAWWGPPVVVTEHDKGDNGDKGDKDRG